MNKEHNLLTLNVETQRETPRRGSAALRRRSVIDRVLACLVAVGCTLPVHGQCNGFFDLRVARVGQQEGPIDVFDQVGDFSSQVSGLLLPRKGRFTAGDFDGDGVDDLIFTRETSGGDKVVDVFTRDGSVQLDRLVVGPDDDDDDGLAAAQFRGDAREDILIGRSDTDSIDVFDDGGFVPPSILLNTTESEGLAPGNVLAAGNLQFLPLGNEIVVAEHRTGDVVGYDSNGAFVYRLMLRRAGQVVGFRRGDGFTVSDLDGDGFDEILVLRRPDDLLEVFDNDASFLFDLQLNRGGSGPLFEDGDRLAVVNDRTDIDGDGLFDAWERDGIHRLGGCETAVDLPGYGADVRHKDLFIQMDWRPGMQPPRASIQTLKEVFALAPMDAGGNDNPDGQDGINLWIDTGSATENGILVGDDLGGGGNVIGFPVICLDDSFYMARDTFLQDERLLAFRYLVFGISPGENMCDDGSMPGGLAEIGGNDAIVYTTDPGVILHELGHNLNLRHGGFENLNNKPNYISMMNYNYGTNIPQVSGGGIIDFSPPRCANCPDGRASVPDPLDETALFEENVLDPDDDSNFFVFRTLDAVTTLWPMNGRDINGDGLPDIDWDGDGNVSNPPVMVDINEDGKCVGSETDDPIQTTPVGDDVLLSDNIIHDGLNRVCETTADVDNGEVQLRDVLEGQKDLLASHDDWRNMRLGPSAFGDLADGPMNLDEPERSLAEIQAVIEELNSTDLAVSVVGAPQPTAAGGTTTYVITVRNDGPNPTGEALLSSVLSPGASFTSNDRGCVITATSLICNIDDLAPGESFAVNSTALVAADLVFAAGGPTTVQIESVVENLAGPDPVSGNDTATETLQIIAVADLAFAGLEVVNPPAELVEKVEAHITHRAVLKNMGPSTPIDAVATTLVTTHPVPFSGVTPRERSSDINALGLGEFRLHEETFEISCRGTGLRTLTFQSTLTPDSAEDLDPEPTNQLASIELGIQCLPDCNDNRVDDAIDITGGFSADIDANGVPDECQIGQATWQFSGTAEGGNALLTVEGFSQICSIALATMVGEPAASVAIRLADAVNADACLSSQEITAAAAGSSVTITGFLISHDRIEFSLEDPGLMHGVPTVEIPTLSMFGLFVMAALIALYGVASRNRRTLPVRD